MTRIMRAAAALLAASLVALCMGAAQAAPPAHQGLTGAWGARYAEP